jgi:hypothetical protein
MHMHEIPLLNSNSPTIAFAGRNPNGSAGDSGSLQYSAVPSLSQRSRPPSFCWGLVGYWCCREPPPYNIYMAHRHPGIWLLSFLRHRSSCTRRVVFACASVSAAAIPCETLKRHLPQSFKLAPSTDVTDSLPPPVLLRVCVEYLDREDRHHDGIHPYHDSSDDAVLCCGAQLVYRDVHAYDLPRHTHNHLAPRS